MSPERWQQVSTVYDSVVALAPEARQEYLDTTCRDDPELRQQVQSLLDNANRPVVVDQSLWDVADGVLDDQSPNLPEGTQIGPYQIASLVGAGGMGQVYRARDTKLQREVALKVLADAIVPDQERLLRFTREAHALASLNHPNIASIFGFEENPIPALALEFVDAPTLAERIARGPLPLNAAIAIARQIADALEAAHQRGIVHRDLKPANIKVRDDGTVKVLDFGLAKIAHAIPSTSPPPETTRAGVILGTAAYMSPEQATGGIVDKRSDIWAFGCVLFEMITGARAFTGDTTTDIISNVLGTEPDWHATRRLPPSLQRLLTRCLQKDPRRRLADIADARLELNEVETAPSEPSQSEGHWLSRRRLAWISLGSITALAMTITAVALLMSRLTPVTLETRLEVVTPPTPDPLSLALSPDGRQLAFIARADDGPAQLWVRSFGERDARPLPKTTGATLPFWSPDAESLGFFADRKFKRVDLATGVVTTLADAGGGGGGSWNRDGTIVFAPSKIGPIVRIAATGGTPVPVTALGASHQGHVYPQFLSDGRRFLFYVRGPATVSGIYASSIDGAQPTRLIEGDVAAPAFAPLGHLLFVRQGKLFAQPLDQDRLVVTGNSTVVGEPISVDERNFTSLSATTAGTIAYRSALPVNHQLVWFDRAGARVANAGTTDAGRSTSLSLSPDGRWLAVHRGASGNLDIWLFDTSNGVFSRFTTSEARETGPIWSPDGRRLVFGSQRNGAVDLYLKDLQGNSQLLLADGQSRIVSDWSPDGKFLLIHTSRDGSRDIWALPLNDPAKPMPIVRTPFEERNAQFSPDGKWIAYVSDESGEFEVYVQPFGRSGDRQRISTSGGAQVRWARSGKELFYIAVDDWLMSVPISVSHDADTFQAGTPARLFRTHVGGAVQPAAEYQYVVSPDGGRFLMNTIVDEPPSPIDVILNWQPRTATSR